MSLVRVPFYFINFLPTSLLYIPLLLSEVEKRNLKRWKLLVTQEIIIYNITLTGEVETRNLNSCDSPAANAEAGERKRGRESTRRRGAVRREGGPAVCG